MTKSQILIKDTHQAITLAKTGEIKVSAETLSLVKPGPDSGILFRYGASKGAVPVNGPKFLLALRAMSAQVRHHRTKKKSAGSYFVVFQEKDREHKEIDFTLRVFDYLRSRGYTDLECFIHRCEHDGAMALGMGVKHDCARYNDCLSKIAKFCKGSSQEHCPIDCSQFVPVAKLLNPWKNQSPSMGFYL